MSRSPATSSPLGRRRPQPNRLRAGWDRRSGARPVSSQEPGFGGGQELSSVFTGAPYNFQWVRTLFSSVLSKDIILNRNVIYLTRVAFPPDGEALSVPKPRVVVEDWLGVAALKPRGQRGVDRQHEAGDDIPAGER